MSWTDKQTLEFIRMYKIRPILWDPTKEGYKNKNKRHDLLIEMSEHFNMEKIEVEKKIKSLQTQFARERKKEKDSKKSTSKWFAYQSLMFLVNKSKSTAKATNTEASGKKELKKDIEKIESQSEYIEYEGTRRSSLKKIRKELISPKKPIIIQPKQNSYVQAATTASPILIETLNLMKSMQAKKDDKDEFALFGEQVAVRLRKIPSLEARFVIQNIINQALFDGEMGVHNACTVNRNTSANASANNTQFPYYSFRTNNITSQPVSSQSISDSPSPVFKSEYSACHSPSPNRSETIAEQMI